MGIGFFELLSCEFQKLLDHMGMDIQIQMDLIQVYLKQQMSNQILDSPDSLPPLSKTDWVEKYLSSCIHVLYLYPKFERSSVLSVCSLGRIRLISHSLSANEQYFSLTLNQPTLLSAMAYKPNKPKRTGPCLETLATHLYLLYEDDSDIFRHQKKSLTILCSYSQTLREKTVVEYLY